MRLRATERQMFEALRKFYPPAEFALLPQVSNGTGVDARRHADAIAMGLWPSRGLAVHGFEIKSSPSDWKRELRNPAKAEDVAIYCNYWWVVAGYQGLVKPGELPEGWGLYEFDHETKELVMKCRAPKRDAKIDSGFIAACLRRASEIMTPQAELDKAYERGLMESRRAITGEVRRLTETADVLRKSIKEFEETSGVTITRWNAGDIGAAVKVVLSGGIVAREARMIELCDRILTELKGKLTT